MSAPKHHQARQLFFQSDMSQQQIADLLDVNRKTIGLWIKEGRWQHMKQVAHHGPAIALESLHGQLANLNAAISRRDPEEQFPTPDESLVQRRLMMSIKTGSGQPIANYLQIFSELLGYVSAAGDTDVKKRLSYYMDKMVTYKKRHRPSHMFLYDEEEDNFAGAEPYIEDEEQELEQDLPVTATQEAASRNPNDQAQTTAAPKETPPLTTNNQDHKTSATQEAASRTTNDQTLAQSQESTNATLCNITENAITLQQQTSSPVPPPITSHINSSESVTLAQTISLPSGICWLGNGNVFDPVINKKREIKYHELQQLYQLGFTRRQLGDW
ncbi:MAG: sigma-70 family RNA polymerase sigma factor [Taibaiella sp.]|nr:sigma-70 family RNA polymerase sigma factor [Taibaiella sp.]